jgi:hypothetical protein
MALIRFSVVKSVGACILPDVAAVAAEAAELHVITMASFTALKDEDQFVLGASTGKA